MVDTVAINNKFALGMRMGPVFQTTVIPLMGGYEDRNQDWQVALWKYEVELRNRPLAEIRAFVAHVLGRRGSSRLFPLRDPLDNTLADENIGTGDGVATEFQITKTYADDDRPYKRPLAIVSNLVVKVGGVTQVESVDFNHEDGWVAFRDDQPPAAGLAITVSCDFLIAVRYEADHNPLTLPIGPGTSNAFASAGPFVLVERHVPKPELVPPVSVLAISGTPVLMGVEGFAYAGFTVSAAGGVLPYTFTVHSGSLPAGVTLNSSTGVVSGTPTTAGTSSGIVIRVTDGVGSTDDLDAFSIEVTAADPHFISVVLLCGFNGADGSTSTTDEATAKAITFNGNAQLDTAQKKFGTASLLLDGTGDRLELVDSSDWQLGSTNSSPWTVEAWVRWNVLDANNRGIIGQNAAAGWFFTGSSTIGELAFGSSNFSTITTSGASMTTGVWYHLAADHDSSGKIRLYVDGLMLGSATPANSAIANVASPLAIGAQGGSGQVDMNGWLDEVRITKGVARYASDSGFAVPTTAFPRS
ncbi:MULTISPECIES: DUF2460 domain-containing protein [unclassified Mesorhizobium]|uniref:DUF2460 domain-containing protein n=1 Tax=unclassified Mesorhizobium TaxID=325217 RepID=UPI000FCAA07F|nr:MULTISPECIES: DUF2460 domain-containing protein [unclassified Mesorhizobium]RUT88128.1 hypothetical protein EOD14_07950 [Mesorhizobium sp. M7A.T.Ca.US.000.02.1.1]RUT91865.1 hypothetical protein EOD15_12875 [Mesorhizobium sp. M7A.T.Ca.US.000.02.2.1]RUU65018.1 hypothetical protein EOC99_10685 [Mesorhizobium sp. M7A.T.Ca.TU.009.01.1.1]RUU77656.1 hypothetical protein EOD03_21795 [Mesorhizobium sp. M7A.T.Ca.TU.009.01.1.2]